MLTHDEIDWFDAIAATLPRSCDDTLPAFMLHLGLVEVGRGDRWILSPAGHDLLATIPHLPEPEPEPAPPSCSRCGGETEVPLFMGPLMMPCPSCSNDDGSPKRDDEVIDASYTFDVGPTERPPGDGWVHIDSVVKAKAFVGCMVEVWAPASTHWGPHEFHGTAQRLRSASRYGLTFANEGIHWSERGNVYLRPADGEDAGRKPSMDHPWMLAAAGWVHIDSEAAALRFVGRLVEIHAPAVGKCYAHELHGERRNVIGAWGGSVYFDDAFIFWDHRGNIHFRPVAE